MVVGGGEECVVVWVGAAGVVWVVVWVEVILVFEEEDGEEDDFGAVDFGAEWWVGFEDLC